MNRYIDAEKLKKHYAWWESGSDDEFREFKHMFDQIIDLQPAADVVEQKHGEWIEKSELVPGVGLARHYNCSDCGTEQMWCFKYCPECGAKMELPR